MDSQKLIAADHQGTFDFFLSNLGEFLTDGLTRSETLYVASVLAHYAQTSRAALESVPVLAGLSELFDTFVLSRVDFGAELLEIAGAQSLLFNGFFRDQMSRRHDVRFYDNLGRSFYRGASLSAKDKAREELFFRIAANFPTWAIVCRDMSRNFRDNQKHPLLLQ